MAQQPLRPAEWLSTADQFLKAGELLGQHWRSSGEMLMFPDVACRAFASEAYIKCLLAIYGKHIPRHHDLHDLFGCLPLGDRRTIEGWWNAESLPSVLKSKITHPEPIPTPQTLNQALKMCGNAFIEWRYRTSDRMFWYLGGFPRNVRRLILQAKPEWEDSPPDSLGGEPQPKLSILDDRSSTVPDIPR